MSRKEKLLERFRAGSKDFTWDELIRLMGYMGYTQREGNGSRVRFIDADGQKLLIHKPHPGNIIKPYLMKEIDEKLMEHGKYG